MTALINYVEILSEQMSQTRYRDGNWERLENGQWVPWRVLKLDRLGRLEALRATSRAPRTQAA
jgi:hypothetical protein